MAARITSMMTTALLGAREKRGFGGGGSGNIIAELSMARWAPQMLTEKERCGRQASFIGSKLRKLRYIKLEGRAPASPHHSASQSSALHEDFRDHM
jgi:hypothetical protein